MFDSIPDAVEAIKRGEFVVVLDDEDRENEGDLIIAASTCTTKQMAWFIQHTSGFICISLTPERIAELEIPMMVPNNTEKNKTAYTVTVDYKHGTTTGISAHDRALTSRMLANGDGNGDKDAKPDDFTRPGHMNPLRYTPGGVRVRMGHTEASVDLCKLAGLPPAGLLCELVDPDDSDGGIASRDACLKFAKQHSLKITTIELLKKYREEQEGQLPHDIARTVQGDQASLDQARGVKLDKQQVVPPTSASLVNGST
ncbi:putative RIB3-3,4-dihydroxy-2-butanone 4-phosphate synthase [Testicularia cyperi]|uniref:3,4-dihydroxy-2-butanone 4-phosphate synthase n=1 Tax=Testicularia cyperi TaxID=1882483 RepID=A0A317XV94_9BASI|nr:putative RIB3-3,4-dihydroxy-2-butanone 4-phosphate synthase [Testicularia cyperi]